MHEPHPATDTGTDTSTDETTSQEATATIEIAADVDRVWRALTSESGLAGWMGEGSTIGFAPGDEIFFADVVTGEPKRGEINEIEQASRLRYAWWPEADDQQRSDVSITLEPVESGTRVVVVETRRAVPSVTATASVHRASVSLATNVVASWSWRCAMLVLATQLVVTPALARLS